MRSTYVVRELVSVGAGEKAFRTHYEYGCFPTYEAANECAVASKNTSCFPQKEGLFPENENCAGSDRPLTGAEDHLTY
jgi:hypothetical protein